MDVYGFQLVDKAANFIDIFIFLHIKRRQNNRKWRPLVRGWLQILFTMII